MSIQKVTKRLALIKSVYPSISLQILKTLNFFHCYRMCHHI